MIQQELNVIAKKTEKGVVEFEVTSTDQTFSGISALLTCLNSEFGRTGAVVLARAVLAEFDVPTGRKAPKDRRSILGSPVPQGSKPVLRVILGGKGAREQQ